MAASEVPLRPEQIEAAQAIYERYTEDWRSADDALAALAASMPDFNPSAVLLKAVAVNSLYSTHVVAIRRAAQHLGDVLDSVDLASAGPELVEKMADIPRLPGRRVRSFASKFAHFFIDYDRFPIYDGFAARMLWAHLGRSAPAPDSGASYLAYEKAFRTLAQAAGLHPDTRPLDRYLWIVGRYRT